MKFFTVIVFCLALPLQHFAWQRDEDHDAIEVVEQVYEVPVAEEQMHRVASTDTTFFDVRSVEAITLDKLRKDSDLRYEAPPTIAENLFDRFMNWLGQLLDGILNASFSTSSGRVVVYIVTAIIVGFIIFFILKSTAFKAFLSNRKVVGDDIPEEYENIHDMDFDSLLSDAIAMKDYRRGVRLLFLSALKILSDRELIRWEQGKTNHEYMTEIKQAELVDGFNQMSYYFDYAWYGDFQVTEETFNRVQGIFSIWKTKIK
jgi:hypothetical protein